MSHSAEEAGGCSQVTGAVIRDGDRETLDSIAGSFSGHRKLSGFSRAEGLSNPGGKVDTGGPHLSGVPG